MRACFASILSATFHLDKLRLDDLETRFLKLLVAVLQISGAEQDDTEMVIRDYMQSNALKQDMIGFVAQTVGVATISLTPGKGSPLV